MGKGLQDLPALAAHTSEGASQDCTLLHHLARQKQESRASPSSSIDSLCSVGGGWIEAHHCSAKVRREERAAFLSQPTPGPSEATSAEGAEEGYESLTPTLECLAGQVERAGGRAPALRRLAAAVIAHPDWFGLSEWAHAESAKREPEPAPLLGLMVNVGCACCGCAQGILWQQWQLQQQPLWNSAAPFGVCTS